MSSRTRVSLLALLFGVLFVVGSFSALQAVDVRVGSERRLDFNGDWRFMKGDLQGAELPSFDDSGWRHLRLPHDWAIEGPFDPKINPHEGALPYFGTAWYRKHFRLAGNVQGKRFRIEFDGAMSNSRVWINGKELGGRPYGYIGFAFDLTPHLHLDGRENVLAVRLNPEPRSSRWYPGAGIYRNVWLDITAPVSVARWGTYITTPEVSDRQATVQVRTEVENAGESEAKITLETQLLDAVGRRVSASTALLTVPSGATVPAVQRLTVVHPERWDIERPYLYKAVSLVKLGGQIVDRYETEFGIRTIEFSREKGFLLNGRKVKLQGVCNHHDLGALGAAVNRRAVERQLEILKSMGVNALRTSHNPPAPEVLQACDRLGILVMDEAFDMWKIPKVPNGLSKFWDEWSERDLRDMLRRDRNHPSVILWSIGNEIPEQSRAEGWKEAERLTLICHQEDPTRPVTAGFNQSRNAIRNGLASKVDVVGFNYKPYEYEEHLRNHPTMIVVGSETASTVSSRGVYHIPLEAYEKHPSLQLSSYDIIAPDWAYPPDVEFEAQEKHPNVLGEFVWTGFDYLGEPTPYFWGKGSSEKDWPARSSYFGIVDLAGFPKDRFYLYQSVWTRKPMVHVLPHWNWAGKEGQPIPVMVYTNTDEVELFLNGRSLGRKKRFSEPVELPVHENVSKDKKFFSKYRLLWQVPYEPGLLRVVGYRDGKLVASSERRTAGPAARVRLMPDRNRIAADGYDLSFVTVRIEDKEGNLCPEADNLVRFRLEGPGEIAGVDNGNPATTESFQANHRKAFNGLALLIVKSKPGQAGQIRITAASEGLAEGRTSITAGR